MQNAIDRITLDVHKAVSQVSLIWKRGDTARTVEAVLNDNGKPFLLDGCTVSFTAPGADPMLHYCEIRDNRIIYEPAPILTKTAGSVLCEFRVVGMGDKVLTTPRFTIEVRDTVVDPDVVEETEKGNIGTLDALISEASELVDEIERKLENGEFVGEAGTRWFFGNVNLSGVSPVDKIPGAKNGDWYLNQNTYSMYAAEDGYWLFVGNARGKSAYEYAAQAGYTGSEEQFAKDLATVGGGGGADLSDSIPLMNGEASPGTSEEASRADHVHPVDTTKMVSADQMKEISSLDNDDSFIVHDVPANETKRMHWSRFRTILKDHFNGNIASNAVTDEAGTGFVATIPELEDDTVLLTEQDIPRIVAAVIAELNK